jgi:hypothetical protein
MGIQDYGGANDPLANPPLGGPNGWAASVAEAITALQGRHEVRSTRPNGTDRLIEVFDGTAWVPAHYDSGLRLLPVINGWTTIMPSVTCRRVNLTVTFAFYVNGSEATSDILCNIPEGFREHSGSYPTGLLLGGDALAAVDTTANGAELRLNGVRTSGMWGTLMLMTDPTIPASLPGILDGTAP